MTFYTIMVGEEIGSKIKAFLIAPNRSNLNIGDKVVSGKLTYRVVLTTNYAREDESEWTLLSIALGPPSRISKIIREEQIKWEEDEDNVVSELDG